MAKNKKRYLVCLTTEALTDTSETLLRKYVHWEKMLLCTTFVPDTPFCQIAALNPDSPDQVQQEFLIPHRYVNWVAVSEDETAFGFGELKPPRST